jgi:hypothetical protein
VPGSCRSGELLGRRLELFSEYLDLGRIMAALEKDPGDGRDLADAAALLLPIHRAHREGSRLSR